MSDLFENPEDRSSHNVAHMKQFYFRVFCKKEHETTYKEHLSESKIKIFIIILTRVGRSKPPPVLTGGFNRLKPPWSILPKVVNSGQYSAKWSILVRVVNWKF